MKKLISVVEGMVLFCGVGVYLIVCGLLLCTESVSFAGDIGVKAGKNAAGEPVIQVSAQGLGRNYLLSSILINQAPIPGANSMGTKIVRFEKVSKERVVLFEDTGLHSASATVPTQMMLTEFPARELPGGSVEIDFGAGMQQVYLSDTMWASDLYGRQYSAELAIARIETSGLGVVRSIENAGAALEIRQLVQLNVDTQQNGVFLSPTVEMVYSLAPYVQSGTYKPRMGGDFKEVGFFESAPTSDPTRGGDAITRIASFDLTRPIKVSISNNTPKEFVESVRAGILYWNGVFEAAVGKKNAIEVSVAQPGVEVGDGDGNMVQWVDYDGLGMAYANLQSNPASGEILKGWVQVYSGWAAYSNDTVRRKLRMLGDALTVATQRESIKKDPGESEGTAGRTAGFVQHSQTVCSHGTTGRSPSVEIRAQIESLTALLGRGLSDAEILRTSQRVIATVVAHEVGHMLGLRHNFAGNLGATASLDQIQEDFLKIARGQALGAEAEARAPSSTVMDYFPIEDVAVIGERLVSGGAPLAYDVQAIAWGYSGKRLPAADRQLFCTDSNVGSYLDCQRFDSGPNPIAFGVFSLERSTSLLPYMITEALIGQRLKPVDERTDIAATPLSPKAWASWLGLQQAVVAMWFSSSDVSSLIVNRAFVVADDTNVKERNAAKRAWAESQLVLGSEEQTTRPDALTVDRVFFSLLPNAQRVSGSERLGDRYETIVSSSLPIITAGADQKMAMGNPIRFNSLAREQMAWDPYAQVVAYLKRAEVRAPKSGGRQYFLQETDLAAVRSRAADFFKEFDQSLVSEALKVYAEGAEVDLGFFIANIHIVFGFDRPELSAEFVRLASQVAETVLLASTGETLNFVALQVPVLSYPPAVRAKAVGIMRADLVGEGEQVNGVWSKPQRAGRAERAALKEKVAALIPGDLGTTTDASKLTPALEDWLYEVRQAGEVSL